VQRSAAQGIGPSRRKPRLQQLGVRLALQVRRRSTRHGSLESLSRRQTRLEVRQMTDEQLVAVYPPRGVVTAAPAIAPAYQPGHLLAAKPDSHKNRQRQSSTFSPNGLDAAESVGYLSKAQKSPRLRGASPGDICWPNCRIRLHRVEDQREQSGAYLLTTRYAKGAGRTGSPLDGWPNSAWCGCDPPRSPHHHECPPVVFPAAPTLWLRSSTHRRSGVPIALWNAHQLAPSPAAAKAEQLLYTGWTEAE